MNAYRIYGHSIVMDNTSVTMFVTEVAQDDDPEGIIEIHEEVTLPIEAFGPKTWAVLAAADDSDGEVENIFCKTDYFDDRF